MEIKELDKCLINMANSASFSGERGEYREKTYKNWLNTIISWDISDDKKQKFLDELYKRNMDVLRYEAAHVSPMVAGPSKYNSKKLDKSDKILELSAELCNWFEKIEKQYNESKNSKKEDQYIIDRIYRYNEMKLDMTKELEKLAVLNVKEFIKIYDEFYETYRWRRNSKIYKMYENAKQGKLEDKNEKLLFEDDNYKVYSKKDRIFIKFVFQVKNQLIYALKKKGFFWNSYEKAWSTYPERYEKNKDWVKTISMQYEKYI